MLWHPESIDGLTVSQGFIISKHFMSKVGPATTQGDQSAGDGKAHWEDVKPDFVGDDGPGMPVVVRQAHDEAKLLGAKIVGDKDVVVEKFVPDSKWVIGPKNNFRFCWDITSAVVLLFLAIDVPARVGLNEPASGHSYRLALTVDLFFYIDIVLNFFLAYENEATGEIISSMQGIRRQYFKGWFFVDVIASLPIDLAERLIGDRFVCALRVPSDCKAQDASQDTNGQLIRLVKLIRLFRLVKMLRLVRIQRLLNRYQDELFVYMGCINICKLITMLFFVGHLLGCFFFFFSTDDWRTEEERKRVENGFQPWIEANFGQGGETLAEVSIARKYVTAQYWAFTTMTTVGYGDISAATLSERMYAIFGMVVGGLTFSVLVGSMTTLVGNDLSKQAESDRMNLVAAYVRDCQLPHQLRIRVLQYFRRQTVRAYSERAFLNELPNEHREDVLIHCYGKLLRQLPLFNQLDDPQARNIRAFTLEIMRNVIPKTVSAGTMMVHEGEKPTAMYLLKDGVIGVDLDDDGQSDHKLSAPTYFGEESILGTVKNVFSYRAISQVAFLELPKDETELILERYPRVRLQLETSWEKRRSYFGSDEPEPKATHLPTVTAPGPRSSSAESSSAGDAVALVRVMQLEKRVEERFDALDKKLSALTEMISKTLASNQG